MVLYIYIVLITHMYKHALCSGNIFTHTGSMVYCLFVNTFTLYFLQKLNDSLSVDDNDFSLDVVGVINTDFAVPELMSSQATASDNTQAIDPIINQKPISPILNVPLKKKVAPIFGKKKVNLVKNKAQTLSSAARKSQAEEVTQTNEEVCYDVVKENIDQNRITTNSCTTLKESTSKKEPIVKVSKEEKQQQRERKRLEKERLQKEKQIAKQEKEKAKQLAKEEKEKAKEEKKLKQAKKKAEKEQNKMEKDLKRMQKEKQLVEESKEKAIEESEEVSKVENETNTGHNTSISTDTSHNEDTETHLAPPLHEGTHHEKDEASVDSLIASISTADNEQHSHNEEDSTQDTTDSNADSEETPNQLPWQQTQESASQESSESNSSSSDDITDITPVQQPRDTVKRKRMDTVVPMDSKRPKKCTKRSSPTVSSVWVQCDKPDCLKWRLLKNVVDANQLPEKWYCSMNEGTV